MHHAMIYFKNDGVPHYISLCVISDDLEHETCFVQELQRIIMLYIKENLPQMESVDYFSDGCVGQYKNYRTFLKFYHQKSDFNIDATWAFFCNKPWEISVWRNWQHCETQDTSLQRSVNNQILTFRAVKEYWNSSIKESLSWWSIRRVPLQ